MQPRTGRMCRALSNPRGGDGDSGRSAARSHTKPAGRPTAAHRVIVVRFEVRRRTRGQPRRGLDPLVGTRTGGADPGIGLAICPDSTTLAPRRFSLVGVSRQSLPGTHWRRIALRSVEPGTPCCLAISAGRCPALDSLTHPALFSLVMDHGRLKAPGQEKSDGATSRLRPAQFIRVGGATNSAGLSRPTAMTCPLLVNLASAHRRPP